MTHSVPRSTALHMARVTIEARTALSIGGGEGAIFDVSLSRDANGLPCIPGSSIQGALRHLWSDIYADGEESSLLGSERSGSEMASRVMFGWGCLHDSAGKAVIGRHPDAPDFADPLLIRLAEDAPLHRHHAPLGHRHTVDGPAKHERAAVPKGTRFSIEFTMQGSGAEADIAKDGASLEKLLALLGHVSFRLGGASSRGYGAIEIVTASYECFELNSNQSFNSLRLVRLDPPSKMLSGPVSGLQNESRKNVVTVRLSLVPKDLWRIGNTGAPQTERHKVPTPANGRPGADQRSKPADSAPVREPFIRWTKNEADKWLGVWCEPSGNDFSFGGSGIRGILAHRALFHWNRTVDKKFIDADSLIEAGGDLRSISNDVQNRRPERLAEFFGSISETENDKSRAGRLLIDDVIVKADGLQAIDHNSIDRFTGGVRNRVLFSEEAVVGGSIELDLVVRAPHRADPREDWPDEILNVVLAALDDLCSERVAIGAKSMGHVSGSIIWGGDDKLMVRWRDKWVILHPSITAEAKP